MLIIPSKIATFRKNVIGFIVIDTGHISKGMAGGTFASMNVFPMEQKTLEELDGDVEMKHNAHDRIRVDIKRFDFATWNYAHSFLHVLLAISKKKIFSFQCMVQIRHIFHQETRPLLHFFFFVYICTYEFHVFVLTCFATKALLQIK